MMQPCLSQSGVFIAPDSSHITSPVTGQTWLLNSTTKTVNVWNGSSYLAVNTPFSNFAATAAPTINNDNTQGYVVGSFWFNTTTTIMYVCTNPATGAAVWHSLGLGTVTNFSAGNLTPYFTTSVTNSTSTPALSFTASTFPAGTILSNTGGGSAVPSANTLTLTAGNNLTGGGNLTSSPTIGISAPVTVVNGGTGLISSPTNGQLLIGSTGAAGYVLGTLTAGSSKINISNGAGSITLDVNQGNLTLSSIGGQVTLAQLPSIGNNTVLGNVSGSSAAPTALTATQLLTVVPVVYQQGRIYGASGTPYNNGGGSVSTIFFGPLPDKGNLITLDNGSGVLSTKTFTEISLSLATGFTSGNVYDVYVYNNSGTLTLDTAVWTNTTTPPTRGSDAAGRLTKNGATNELLVGAIFMTSNTTTQDNGSARYISNVFNTDFRGMSASDSTASWTVTSTTFVAANGNTTNGQGRVSFLQAVSSNTFTAHYTAYYANNSTTQTLAGIGIDSTTSTSNFGVNNTGAASSISVQANIGQSPGSLVGVHFVQRVEAVQGTSVSSTATGGVGWNTLSVVILN